MKGTNPIRPPEKGDGKTLQIVEIFYTLQGEGIYAGWPAVFIRLGGCNLACDFCDTQFERFEKWAVDKIIQEVQSYKDKASLVVITGGEPLRQPINFLCITLLANNFQVQIETNGTLWNELDARVDIMCSPKVTNGQYHALRPDLLERINALKFIISTDRVGYEKVPEIGQSAYNIPIYVQPMDEEDTEKNAANQALALELALKHGYRMSLQTHKILGIA